jgi:hypothetical protein
MRFVRALMLGLKEVRVSNPRIVARRVTVVIDPRVLTFNDKSYLRYTIQNNGDADFAFNSISLEAGAAGSSKGIPADVVQSKDANKLAPGESLAGVMIFDSKLSENGERLTLFVRAVDNSEIARLTIVQ